MLQQRVRSAGSHGQRAAPTALLTQRLRALLQRVRALDKLRAADARQVRADARAASGAGLRGSDAGAAAAAVTKGCETGSAATVVRGVQADAQVSVLPDGVFGRVEGRGG